jgi:hypothetical protein
MILADYINPQWLIWAAVVLAMFVLLYDLGWFKFDGLNSGPRGPGPMAGA